MSKNTIKELPADSQHTCFLETARALGCDEDEAAFDEKLKAVTRPQSKVLPPETNR